MAPANAPVLPRGSGLPLAWRGVADWRVLDTDFGDGTAFLATWEAWLDDRRRPRALHYVAIAPHAPARDRLLGRLADLPALAGQAADLRRQWFGVLPGFQRIALAQGELLLTLCIGPLQAMLREQRFIADTVYLRACTDSPAWDRWTTRSLARLCRRGTRLALEPASDCVANTLAADLAQAGFAPSASRASGSVATAAPSPSAEAAWEFQPRWDPPHTRDAWRAASAHAASCVVVGAGIAGATVAAALARRGWQVTVLDAAPQPASGASGLPVGLFAPLQSRDDNTRSRISRAGVRATLLLCQRMLQEGEDWAHSGVLQLLAVQEEARVAEGAVAESLGEWSATSVPSGPVFEGALGMGESGAAVRHLAAGWVRPARLVQACLAVQGVRLAGNRAVQAIRWQGDRWQLLDAAGHVLAEAPQVVLAAAGDALRLVDSAGSVVAPARPHGLSCFQAIAGQLSWGTQEDGDAERLPPFPVNGHGSLIPHIPTPEGKAWFAGATYEPGADVLVPDAEQGRAANLERLATLLPATARWLAPRFQAGARDWRGVRYATSDRLPVVGTLHRGEGSGLWICAGMGSRGLTYAALCAELLAASLNGEPQAVEASLAKALDPGRAALRA